MLVLSAKNSDITKQEISRLLHGEGEFVKVIAMRTEENKLYLLACRTNKCGRTVALIAGIFIAAIILSIT